MNAIYKLYRNYVIGERFFKNPIERSKQFLLISIIVTFFAFLLSAIFTNLSSIFVLMGVLSYIWFSLLLFNFGIEKGKVIIYSNIKTAILAFLGIFFIKIIFPYIAGYWISRKRLERISAKKPINIWFKLYCIFLMMISLISSVPVVLAAIIILIVPAA